MAKEVILFTIWWISSILAADLGPTTKSWLKQALGEFGTNLDNANIVDGAKILSATGSEVLVYYTVDSSASLYEDRHIATAIWNDQTKVREKLKKEHVQTAKKVGVSSKVYQSSYNEYMTAIDITFLCILKPVPAQQPQISDTRCTQYLNDAENNFILKFRQLVPPASQNELLNNILNLIKLSQ